MKKLTFFLILVLTPVFISGCIQKEKNELNQDTRVDYETFKCNFTLDVENQQEKCEQIKEFIFEKIKPSLITSNINIGCLIPDKCTGGNDKIGLDLYFSDNTLSFVCVTRFFSNEACDDMECDKLNTMTLNDAINFKKYSKVTCSEELYNNGAEYYWGSKPENREVIFVQSFYIDDHVDPDQSIKGSQFTYCNLLDENFESVFL